MGETTGAGTPAGTRGAHATSRVPLVLGALAGALAIAGSMITWVTVERGKLTTQLRGTEFGVGALTFACGIVIVIAIAAWALGSDTRLRAATAAIVLAAGAVVTIAIGSSLATRALFDQAAPANAKQKHGHHQKKGGGEDANATPTSSATAVGVVHVPEGSGGTALSPGTEPRRSFVALADAAAGGANRHARKKAVTSTLQPGVFIALAGGVLAMVAGLWGLLTGRAAGPASGGPTGAAAAGSSGGASPQAPSEARPRGGRSEAPSEAPSEARPEGRSEAPSEGAVGGAAGGAVGGAVGGAAGAAANRADRAV